MRVKLICCLALAGLLTGLFPAYVQASPGVLDYVTLTPTVEYLLKNQEFRFYAGAFDSNNAPISGLTFTWSVVTGGGIIGTGLLSPYGWADFKAGTVSGTFYETVQVAVTQGPITRSAKATVTIVEYPPYIYGAENGNCQLIQSPGTDNCVDYSWAGVDPLATPPYTSYWGADTTEPIYTDIGVVIGNWQAAVPYLDWEEVTPGHDTTLMFFYKTNPCYTNALGCHSVAVATPSITVTAPRFTGGLPK